MPPFNLRSINPCKQKAFLFFYFIFFENKQRVVENRCSCLDKCYFKCRKLKQFLVKGEFPIHQTASSLSTDVWSYQVANNTWIACFLILTVGTLSWWRPSNHGISYSIPLKNKDAEPVFLKSIPLTKPKTPWLNTEVPKNRPWPKFHFDWIPKVD